MSDKTKPNYSQIKNYLHEINYAAKLNPDIKLNKLLSREKQKTYFMQNITCKRNHAVKIKKLIVICYNETN